MPTPSKTDNVHRLNGTYRNDRHGDPDTKPDWDTDAPQPPEYLDAVALAEWDRIIAVVPDGVITKTDMTLLVQYCMMVSALVASVDNNDRPFLAADHTQLRLIQQELGFTPISRGKIGGAPKAKDEGGFQSLKR